MRAFLLFSTFFHFALSISIHSRSVEPTQRIDCFPDAASPYSGYSKKACLARNCLYDDWTPPGVKQCYLSPNYGYILRESPRVTAKGMQFRLQRNEAVGSMFSSPIRNVVLDVQYYTDDILRFKLYDEDNERYEVPIQLNSPSDYISLPQYEFINGSLPANNRLFSFAIKRRANQATLFDTSLGGLVLNDQFLQIVTRLQSPHVYGLGENNHETLKHDVNERRTWGIFGRDQGTHWSTNTNHYGSHPFYLVMEQDSDASTSPTGNMHGVLLLNSNAMDYSFEPTPSLTMRTIGGVLDFFVFLGPKPEQVVQQYTWLIGRSILPPYWSLGFQLARWDYGNITHMKHVVQRNLDAGIPLDVQYADIDYMDAEKDFTIDPINYPGLKEYFKQLNDDGIRTIVILDPGTIDDQVYYQPTIEGIREDVFIKWDDGQGLMKGACWPGEVFFPDFFTQRAQNWWSRWINDFYRVNLTFDGLWIDMNEPALFDTNDEKPWNSADTLSNHTLKCPKNLLEDPPYRTKAVFGYDAGMNRQSRLSDRTLCMSAPQGEIDSRTGKPKYRHYDVHNLYGWSQTKPSLDAMQKATGKRSLVLPRSTFVGSGQWSGHWLGDNGATWTQMKQSIIGMIEFNWFGIPFNGADICGFDGRPTEEMCIRWMQVGAFYPFSRNHNAWKGPDQDPASWSSYAVNVMTSALRIRYTLLPYYYTLFYKAHTQGSTVIRPLFHEYPTDKATFDISSQFLIGSHMMIVPVTDEGAQIVHPYIPSTHWYNYYTGVKISAQKKTFAIAAPLETIPILLRGGAIIPTQEFANNTKLSRKLPFGLTVVLNSTGDAVGDLFYDDGESIDTIKTNSYFYANFTWSSTNGQLIINVIKNNYPEMSQLILDSLTIYGLDEVPDTITVDNRTFQPSKRTNTEIIEVKGLRLAMGTNYTLSWKTSENPIVQPPSAVTDDPKYRVDCFPDPNANENACRARGCNWDLSKGPGIVACYIPKEKGGYELTQGPTQLSDSVTQYSLSRRSSTGTSLYGNDINQLDVQINVSGGDKIRLTIRDANAERYEVPVPIHWNSYGPSESSPVQFHFELTQTRSGQVGFRIRRNNTGSIIFDTSFFAEGFIYDDQYLQFITTTPSRNVYGFGENTHKSFRHILKNSDRYGIFARDQQPFGGNENLYGTHPFYMVIEPNGQAYGVFIFNSNAQDYKFDEFDNDQATLTYRTIGGIFDIFVFAGTTPEQVIRQYQSVIGKPYFPPYWGFGFQLCRYGYNSLDNMKAAMYRTLNASIPIDVHYGDIDYFHNRLDFTWNPVDFQGIPEYIDWLHSNDMKFITMIDPAIDSEAPNYPAFVEGQKADVWIKWPERRNLQFNETGNRNILGYVWPDGKTAFPDYFYPSTNEWWRTQVLEYRKKIKFDGIWIDMNEPANFDTNRIKPWNWNRTEVWNLKCPVEDEILDNPPYKTAICGDYISDKTLCMISEQRDGRGKTYNHYDIHNLYGWSETVATLPVARALENRRSIVISRSTFPSSGAISGHWLGDNTADWKHLKYNIIGMLEFNLFGIPYNGADICGFFADTTEEMCQRWMQLGAFNPFFRNHNGYKFGYEGNAFRDQDPGVFSAPAVASNRRAVELRYTLIPHLYTLFHRVHVSGGTVVRSMAHEFPTIPDCWSLDEQFLWDSSLLIAPVIYENHRTKYVYLPPSERWYDFYTGEEMRTLGNITVPAPLDFLPLYLRGGAIIPQQQSAMNTVQSRKNPLFLTVALDNNQYAQGNLFWDDGESIDTYEHSVYNDFAFSYKSQRLSIEPWTYKYPQMGNDVKLEDIKVYGMDRAPSRILWNRRELSATTQWTFDSAKNVLSMTKLALDVTKSHAFVFV